MQEGKGPSRREGSREEEKEEKEEEEKDREPTTDCARSTKSILTSDIFQVG